MTRLKVSGVLLLHVFHIADDHHGDFECKCVVKNADIQPGAFFQLFQAIDQSIPVDVELPGSLGDI